MPKGVHVGMTEFGIASFMDQAWITDAAIYAAGVRSLSRMPYHLSEPRTFTYFVSAAAFSNVNAQRMRFASVAAGAACNAQIRVSTRRGRASRVSRSTGMGRCAGVSLP